MTDNLEAAFWRFSPRAHDTPFGDFIRDARLDHGMPDDFASAKQLCDYLLNKRTCADCLALTPKIWRRYRQSRHFSGRAAQ